MKFQFYRFYLLLVLAVAVVVWSFNKFNHSFVNEDASYVVEIDYLMNAFEAHRSGTSDAGMPQFSYVDASTLALPESLQQTLANGQSLELVDENGLAFYYRQTDQASTLLKFGPVTSKVVTADIEAYLVVFFYSGLAVLLLLMMRPIFRDLQILQRHAGRFGENPQILNMPIKSSSNIYPLATSFTLMSRKILDFIQMNEDLSKAISHEVRTPLTRMKFLLEAVSGKIDKSEKQQFRDDINDIENLVNDYLSFAQIENQVTGPDYRSHSMKAYVKLVLNKFSLYQDKVSFSSHIAGDKAVFHSPSLALATQSLLSNAMRYASSAIHISFVEDERGFELSVHDDGPGVVATGDGSVQSRAQSELDDNHKSFGLGLYIVQRVAEWHQGEFNIAKSDTLGGAKMSIRWPNIDASVLAKQP